MELIIIILLIVLILCVLFLIFEIKNKENQMNQSNHYIQNMEQDLKKMNQVMTNVKQRGNWGEYQLSYLLGIYAADNEEVYKMQYILDNNKIVDAALFLPGTEKVLCIDSKFPMENYLKMNEDKENQEYYFRLFKNNIKKHIDDVSTKYITPYTANQAILFIPSEAIYQFICSKSSDLFQYALNQHVLLASPTTLIGIIYTLIASTKDFYRQNHVEEIEQDLEALLQDVDRLLLRCDKAQKNLNNLQEQYQMIYTSSQKIGKRIQKITKGEL